MSVQIIYHCDICGQEGHCSETPSAKCIEALKALIKKREDDIRQLEYGTKDKVYEKLKDNRGYSS